MAKIRNLVFVVVSVILLLLPVCHLVITRMPDGAKQSAKSELEGRAYAKFPSVTQSSVLSGQFQGGIERYLSDGIPYREEVLLANASLQRKIIELANVPFSLEAYPTFFGSQVVAIPQYEAVFEIPGVAYPNRAKALRRCAIMINRAARRYPGIRWCVGLADRSRTLAVSPVRNLRSNPADSEFYTKAFYQNLSDDVVSINLFYNDLSKFVNEYYKTDHHWRIEGGVEAYKKICAALGIEPVEYEFKNVYPGPSYGANARMGLIDVYADSINDVVYARSPIEVKVNGNSKEPRILDKSYTPGFAGYEKGGKFTSTYSDYFHANYNLIQITNPLAARDASLLIIGDSFTNCIERLFAEEYREVYVVDPRYINRGEFKGWNAGA